MINTKRRRYIGKISKALFKSYTSKIIRVDEENLSGYSAHIKILEVERPFIVGEGVCIGDAGYSWIQFLPDNENWALCAMYDSHEKIIEWYFDVTRENAVDEEGSPYGDDLYLDLVVMPDGRVLVFDEDELQDAYESNNITTDEFDMAHRVKDELIERKIADADYLVALCSKLSTLFKSEGET